MHISLTVLHDIALHLVDLPDQFPGQDLPRGTLSDDLTIFQHIDPVAEHGRNIEVMGWRKLPWHPVFSRSSKAKLMGNVQMVRGLVQNEAGGLLGQGPGKNHPLLLTAGERRKAPVRKLSHSNGL